MPLFYSQDSVLSVYKSNSLWKDLQYTIKQHQVAYKTEKFNIG